jgi:hypothetical protein
MCLCIAESDSGVLLLHKAQQDSAAVHVCRADEGFINKFELQDLGISFPHCSNAEQNLNGTLSLAVPIVRVVIDSMVTHQAQWSHPPPLGVVTGRLTAVKEAGPAIVDHGNGRCAWRGLRPCIHTLLSGCERLPARAVRAVGTTSGPAGTMQHGGLCMLVVYGKRIQPVVTAIESPPVVTDVAATEGVAPPIEPWVAGGLGQCSLLISSAAQEAGLHAVPQVMGTAMEQAAGQAGAEYEDTPPEPLNTPAPALALDRLPAPAAPDGGCMRLSCGTPGSARQEPPVSNGDDDDVQMTAPGGHATAQPQQQVSGLNVEGATPQLPEPGSSGRCVPQSAMCPAVPHVMSVLPSAGEECQLPADFIRAYGIQSTQVLTTRLAPGW